jgi:hypothetical protein
MRPLSSAVLAFVALANVASAQIPNEECTGAILVNLGANGPYSNNNATTSLPAWQCGAGANDVWFFYLASCTGFATFTTCGANFDTVLQVFDATACANDCANGFPGGGPCNDDSCSSQSRVTMGVVLGGLYFIRVGGFEGNTGTFPLNITCSAATRPADDSCGGAAPVRLGVNGPFTNIGYSSSIPDWPCTFGANDRWFTYQATCTAPHTFDTCSNNTNFDTAIEVFSGACPCNLTSLGCNDDFCDVRSQLTVNLVQNLTYLIRVGGFRNNTGNFDLTINVGTNTGAFNNLGGQCNGAAHTGIVIAATGSPNINAAITIAVSGQTGVPLIGYGFVPLTAPFACCTIGHNYGALILGGPSNNLPIPCDPSLIGGSIYTQAFDVGGNGGCVTSPQLNFTDTIQITIG